MLKVGNLKSQTIINKKRFFFQNLTIMLLLNIVKITMNQLIIKKLKTSLPPKLEISDLFYSFFIIAIYFLLEGALLFS